MLRVDKMKKCLARHSLIGEPIKRKQENGECTIQEGISARWEQVLE